MPKTLSRVELPGGATVARHSMSLYYPGRNEDENLYTGSKTSIRFASARWFGQTEVGVETGDAA